MWTYVSEICAKGFLCLSLVTKKMWKVGQESPIFKRVTFWNLIFRNENKIILRRKLSKPHKKDTILHVTITFSLKQGETRPITLPLNPTSYFLYMHVKVHFASKSNCIQMIVLHTFSNDIPYLHQPFVSSPCQPLLLLQHVLSYNDWLDWHTGLHRICEMWNKVL